jgi:hypothetical protein
MGRIGCVRWKKSWPDFVARTFALIAPVDPVLNRVSCSYKTIPNVPKHYAMQQNMSLGSNRVDWVHSLRKIPTWLRGTNFCINCSSRPCFASSFMQLRNDPKCIPTLCNAQKHEFRVQWPDWVHRCEKSRRGFVARTFALSTSSHYFAPSFMHLRNDPKCAQTLCNTPKHEFRVHWSGLGVFIAKNPDVTLWHELLH